jgi:hypothetical protein
MSPDPSRRFGTIMAFVDALENAFVNVAAGESRRSAADVTTLIGTAIPGSPSRPVSVGAPIRAVVARPPNSAPTVAPASAPSSLTQQFFAEGEQLDSAHAVSQAADAETDDDDDDDGDLATQAARVPRSRPQMILASLLALGSVAVIAGTVVSLANKPAGESPAAQVSQRAPVAAREPISAPSVQIPARAREPKKEATIAVSRGLRTRSRPSSQPPATPAGTVGPATVEPSVPPPPPALPAEAAPAATERRAPDVTAEPNDEGVARPEDEPTRAAPDQRPPTPSEPDESAPSPRAPDIEAAPSAPEPPAPNAPMEGV